MDIDGTNNAEVIGGTLFADDTIVGYDGNDDITGGLFGDDLLIGGKGDDVIWGGLGDDILRGGHGDDTLHGLVGDDRLLGGTGNDTLIAGAGENVLIGGSGADAFVFVGAVGDSVINDFNAAEGDTISIVDWGVNSVSDLALSYDGAGNVVVEYDAYTVKVKGLTETDVTANGIENYFDL